MPLSIKDPEANRLARMIAQRTGETMTQVVIKALREYLAREQRKTQSTAEIESLVSEIMAISRQFASLPLRDSRSLEEMLYDENGLPA